MFPLSANALVKLACPTTESFEEDVKECEDNGKIAQAGIDCTTSLEKAIQEQSAVAAKAMSASNTKIVDKGGNAQTHNFAGSGADYAITQATLAELIAAAKKARNQVEDYHMNIYYPEDFDAPEEMIGDPEEFIAESECFGENKRGLMGLVDKIDRHIADLEKTKALASAKGLTSGSRQEGMQNSLVKGAKDTKAVGSKTPKGTSTNGKSDITGVKEDKQKRSK